MYFIYDPIRCRYIMGFGMPDDGRLGLSAYDVVINFFKGFNFQS